jgi:ZIP family zinc transporter
MMMDESILFAFVLTTLAGLSTGIGSAVAYFINKPKMIYLSLSLGFSAGVMIYVSFVELLPQALDSIGEFWSVIVFFIGILVIGIIDIFIPDETNPHHFTRINKKSNSKINTKLMRTGVFTALAITIHNFPEGLATFGAALSNVKLGLMIAIAIAIHNIPEGISVSMPIYYATNNKNKAFVFSFLSGIGEPIGAVIGFIVLMPFLSDVVLSSMLAFVAGIMVYISIDELLPMAHQYGHNHTVILGFVSGMLIMAVSLMMI